MSNETPLVKVDLTPEYKRNLRELAKKYRQIRSDIQPIIVQLQGGSFIGDRIPGMGEEYVIMKLRIKNSDIQKGKSAGYRLIYQIESPNSILLLTIYSKSQREDIDSNEIRSILAEFDVLEEPKN